MATWPYFFSSNEGGEGGQRSTDWVEVIQGLMRRCSGVRADLPPGTVDVRAEQLNDVARLDVEGGTRRRARGAKVAPDDEHLGET